MTCSRAALRGDNEGDYGLIFARFGGSSPSTRVLRFDPTTGLATAQAVLSGVDVPHTGAVFRGDDRTVLVREANPCSVRERLPSAPFTVVASPSYPCTLGLTQSNQRIASRPN